MDAVLNLYIPFVMPDYRARTVNVYVIHDIQGYSFKLYPLLTIYVMHEILAC